MIVIKGWVQHKDFSFRCKCGDNLTPHQAWMLLQTVKHVCDEKIGRIKLVNRPERFEYIRLDDGRIIVTQI